MSGKTEMMACWVLFAILFACFLNLLLNYLVRVP